MFDIDELQSRVAGWWDGVPTKATPQVIITYLARDVAKLKESHGEGDAGACLLHLLHLAHLKGYSLKDKAAEQRPWFRLNVVKSPDDVVEALTRKVRILAASGSEYDAVDCYQCLLLFAEMLRFSLLDAAHAKFAAIVEEHVQENGQ